MKDTSRNLMVGLFALVGLGALATLIIIFGVTSWGISRSGLKLHARFESAAGIQAGTLVVISGIEVGRVTNVEFAAPPDYSAGVRVEIFITDRRARLTDGTTAVTVEPGLGMGRPPIQILPGPATAPELVSGATIPGRTARAVDSLIPPAVTAMLEKTAAQIGTAAEALEPVLRDMHEILQPRTAEQVDVPGGPQGNLVTAVERLDGVMKHFNEVLGDPTVQSHLKGSLENIYTMSEDGKAFMTDLRGGTADARQVVTDTRELVGNLNKTAVRTDEQLDRIARALLENLEQTSGVLTSIQQVTAGVNGGEGTVGRLMKDDRLYEAMVLTFQRLADTAEEFRLVAKEWQQGRIRVAF